MVNEGTFSKAAIKRIMKGLALISNEEYQKRLIGMVWGNSVVNASKLNYIIENLAEIAVGDNIKKKFLLNITNIIIDQNNEKIISIEVGENSSKIAKQTITHLLDKIKTASKIQIHLNPKDYEILKGQLNLEPFIELKSDANVTAGGVVIASDLGNFDGNIDSKVSSMLDSLDLII